MPVRLGAGKILTLVPVFGCSYRQMLKMEQNFALAIIFLNLKKE